MPKPSIETKNTLYKDEIQIVDIANFSTEQEIELKYGKEVNRCYKKDIHMYNSIGTDTHTNIVSIMLYQRNVLISTKLYIGKYMTLGNFLKCGIKIKEAIINLQQLVEEYKIFKKSFNKYTF